MHRLLSIISLISVLAAARQPNFVLIFTDDQGYGDLGCFGGKHVDTPVIDRLAAEGAKLSNFYVPAAVCTPSRAGLMTGCYPLRIDMHTGSTFGVLLAGDKKGLNPSEITIPEVLKGAGYATGMFGKWHLGDQPEFLPTRQGFDEYFGIPYSHDIHPFHPNQKRFKFPPLPLLNQETVIETDPDADLLTKRITERAVSFIDKHHDKPFFLYVPHPIPHRPLHVSDPFKKSIPAGIKDGLAKENDKVNYPLRDKLFRQAIAEIDWSVGRIIETLKRHKLDKDTLVLFFSDNGPAIGSAGPLRGRKGSTFEGGMREPAVAWWPGTITPGQEISELLTSMDLLPTYAGLAGTQAPSDRVIDGKDIWPILSGEPGAKSPHKAFFYHRGAMLMAVRSGDWKLHLKAGKSPQALYHLGRDIGEKKNVIKANPKVASRLAKLAIEFRAEITANSRKAAFVDNPVPLRKD
ncbi:MAG: arylsulfatase A [Rhodothermales bacterium]|jgi:arylsulfatase A